LTVFFASPARAALKKEIEKRNAKAGVNGKGGKDGGKLSRTASSDSLSSRAPVMGITQDLEMEFDEAISEIRAFEASKKK
jgi:lysophospholipid acyltransferase